jgi:phosphate transport system substrate-binding protein
MRTWSDVAGRTRRAILRSGLILGPFAWIAGRVGARQGTPTADLSTIGGRVISDGSSTVWPIIAEASERFLAAGAATRFDIEISGTGGGFRRFCDNASDLQGASRAIEPDEVAQCEANGVRFAEFVVGHDGITVVVNPANTFAACLSVDQLRALWEPDSGITRWNQIDPSWPDQPLDLVGPGPDSGTFDYFTLSVVGEEGASRIDYTPSENDDDLVELVAQLPDALGYFGFAYYAAEAERVRAVAVDGGGGCVEPSLDTIGDGSYAPLSRPLYVYVNLETLLRPEGAAFVTYLVGQTVDITTATGYVPPDGVELEANRGLLAAALAGETATPVS